MSPAEAVAGLLAVGDAQATTSPWMPSIDALTAEVRNALPDDPAVTEPLVTAICAIKAARPDLRVTADAYPRDLIVRLPLPGRRRHE